MMAGAENKSLARGWFELVLNGRDIDAIDRLYAEDYSYRGPGGIEMSGRDAAKQTARTLIEAMPDRLSTIVDQIAERDRVVTRWLSRGTPIRPLMGCEPDGRQVAVRGITISRIVEDRIEEDWEIIHVVEE